MEAGRSVLPAAASVRVASRARFFPPFREPTDLKVARPAAPDALPVQMPRVDARKAHTAQGYNPCSSHDSFHGPVRCLTDSVTERSHRLPSGPAATKLPPSARPQVSVRPTIEGACVSALRLAATEGRHSPIRPMWAHPRPPGMAPAARPRPGWPSSWRGDRRVQLPGASITMPVTEV
jgi:hypothetical protein